MKNLSLFITAAALASPAFGQGSDECVGATVLAANTPVAFDTTAATPSAPAWDCAAGGAADLWFEYTAGAGGSLVTFELCGSTYDTAIEVFSGSCGGLVLETCNDDACGLQSIGTVSNATAGQVYYVRVGGFAGGTGAGTIVANQIVVPDCSMPDSFEDNDDCASATPIADGSFVGLNVEEADNDYFAVTVADGATLTVDIFFNNSFGDTDLYLWDPLVECDTNVAGTGGAFLVRGFSASDDEQIVYTNTTGASQDLIIEVDMFTAGACNEYDILVDGATSDGVGVSYCDSNPNSTGGPSSLSGAGSAVAADNDLTLNVMNLPADANGYFLVSQTQGFVTNPAGSQGNLCVLGDVGRYPVVSSGAGGSVSVGVDVTQIPRPSGPAAAVAGDTYNFQLWHRDLGGNSNFSNGLEVLFQ